MKKYKVTFEIDEIVEAEDRRDAIEAIKLFIIFVLKVFRMTVGNFIKIPNQTGNTSSTTNAFAGFGMNAKKIKS